MWLWNVPAPDVFTIVETWTKLYWDVTFSSPVLDLPGIASRWLNTLER